MKNLSLIYLVDKFFMPTLQSKTVNNADVAQLARAVDLNQLVVEFESLHRLGCRFRSSGATDIDRRHGSQDPQNLGSYQSGQMGQTVNLLAYAFGGSDPSLPTTRSDAKDLLPLAGGFHSDRNVFAEVAQLIEHQPSKRGSRV